MRVIALCKPCPFLEFGNLIMLSAGCPEWIRDEPPTMVKRITKFSLRRGSNAEEGVDVLLPLMFACGCTLWFPVLSNLWVLAFWAVVLVSAYGTGGR